MCCECAKELGENREEEPRASWPLKGGSEQCPDFHGKHVPAIYEKLAKGCRRPEKRLGRQPAGEHRQRAHRPSVKRRDKPSALTKAPRQCPPSVFPRPPTPSQRLTEEL